MRPRRFHELTASRFALLRIPCTNRSVRRGSRYAAPKVCSSDGDGHPAACVALRVPDHGQSGGCPCPAVVRDLRLISRHGLVEPWGCRGYSEPYRDLFDTQPRGDGGANQQRHRRVPSGQVVFLNAGTYNLSAGITFGSGPYTSNVTLRGAGADQTKLVFSGSVNCSGLESGLCLQANWIDPSGAPNSTTWTAGYAKDSTVLTFGSTAGSPSEKS